jgi:hypothetical protein
MSSALTNFRLDVERGLARPVRFRRGEGVNVWGAVVHDCANRLDAMADKLPPDAIPVLRELFEEIGQQARDMEAFR